jgi:hypothetical protein
MLRMVLFLLLLCGGCTFRQLPNPNVETSCPFPTLRTLPCDEAVRSVAALLQVADRVLFLWGYMLPVGVRLVSHHVAGRDQDLLVEQSGLLYLNVSESFLRQVNRLEVVERHLCDWVVRQRDTVRRDEEGIDVRRCMYWSAFSAGELERARWLARTLPP